jgi:type VI secretion system Hcp family effector
MRRILPVLLLFILCTSVVRAQYIMVSFGPDAKGTRYRAESAKSGYTDKTEVLDFTMKVKSPREASTGNAYGHRQYDAIQFTKEIGASSPQLFSALVGNTTVTNVIFEFYRPDNVYKQPEIYLKVELQNVFVSEIGYTTVNGKEAEQVSLVFGKIIITDPKSKVSTEDNWQQGNR